MKIVVYRCFILGWILFMAGCTNAQKADDNAGTETGTVSPENGHPADSLSSYVSYGTNRIAFIHATIIDGTGQAIKNNQTLLIVDGYFQAVGDDQEISIPENTEVVNLRGKTVIPGIVGMHNHLHIPQFPDVGDAAAVLYLASGVTTIQTCGATSTAAELSLAGSIAEGKQIGPEIIVSAPFITGKGGNPNMIIPRSEQHLRDTMSYWINQGIKWFKVYRNTTPHDLRIILDEAHQNGCKVRGHLCATTFEEATVMGIDAIEHGLNSASDFRSGKEYGSCNGGREYMDELLIDGAEVKKLQQLMIDHSVFLTSTLSIYEASGPGRAYADERSLKAMSPYLRSQYEERRSRFDQQEGDLVREERLKRIMAFDRQYYKMGGLLCSGADAGRHVLPGFGDQRNYQLLIEAGFLPEEAIQVMTGNGAKALERTDVGFIQEGKRADFVILNGDLEKDAACIEKVETVFKHGVGYDAAKLLKRVEGTFGLE